MNTNHKTYISTLISGIANNREKQVLNQLAKLQFGTFHAVTYKAEESKSKKAKGYKDLDLYKIRQFTFRLLPDGENTKVVQENRANGNQPAICQPLAKGCEWVRGLEGLLLTNSQGELQVRTYLQDNQSNRSLYYLAGKEISREQYNAFLIPSALKAKPFAVQYRNLFAKNILAIK